METLDRQAWRSEPFPSVFVMHLFLTAVRDRSGRPLMVDHVECNEDGKITAHPGYYGSLCHMCNPPHPTLKGKGAPEVERGCGSWVSRENSRNR